MIDSGDSFNFISLKACQQLALHVINNAPISVKLADGSIVKTCG